MPRSFAAVTVLALLSSAASAQQAKDPPANLYLLASPGETTLVAKFATRSACKVAADAWYYNQLAGSQDAAKQDRVFVATVCLATE